MNCEKCGIELEPENHGNFCPECEQARQNEAEQNTNEIFGAVAETEPVKPSGKGKKIAIAGVAAAAVLAAGAFAFGSGAGKDPKETVIAAFETVLPEDQVYPIEEIFGWSDMEKSLMESNAESGISLKLDTISEESLAMLEGAGFRADGKVDKTNKKAGFNMVMTYGGMDFLNINGYYGDETLMMSVPEIVNQVFTVDLTDGFVDRLKQSELIGPMMEQSGVDLEAMDQYIKDTKAQMEKQDSEPLFDLEALYDRYKEGSKAQDNFKAALTVEKTDKKEFTMDGASESCKGYNVSVSKDAMIAFLRESSDFFLNDEKLRADYLKQLQYTVRASQIFGASAGYESSSPEDIQQESYDNAKVEVDRMIGIMEKSLTDVTMTVYVDKKGRLAAVDGTTILNGAEEIPQNCEIRFHVELQGGAYLTQNLTGTFAMEAKDGETPVSAEIAFTKTGVSDAKQLTSDIAIEVTGSDMESAVNFIYTGTYNRENKDYHMGLDMVAGDVKQLSISASGVVEKLEKGKSVQIAMDEIRVSVEEDAYYGVLSGSVYAQPLTGEITALEGTTMDVIAATQSDWQNLIMQAYFGVTEIAKQLGMPIF